MALYVVLTKLTSKGRQTVKRNPHRIQEVNREIEKMGLRIVAQYALVGAYDFLTVLEADDPQALTRLSLEFGARGTIEPLFLGAMPIEEYIEGLTKGGK